MKVTVNGREYDGGLVHVGWSESGAVFHRVARAGQSRCGVLLAPYLVQQIQYAPLDSDGARPCSRCFPKGDR